MPPLNYMTQSAYRHRSEGRIRGIMAAGCAVAVFPMIWPLSRWVGGSTDGAIPPIAFALFLLVLASVCLVIAVRAIVRNEIWETCIQDGKLYLSTPSGTQAVDIASIAKFTLGDATGNDSGLIIGKLLLHDGTTVRVDARLVHYPALRRALERYNPQIRFFDMAR